MDMHVLLPILDVYLLAPCLPTVVHCDHEIVRKHLPHEGEALVLDTADIDFKAKTARGYFHIGGHTYRGHLPNYPIHAGHWSLEFANLTGAIMVAVLRGISFHEKKIMVTRAKGEINWTGEAYPGDDLICETTLISSNTRAVAFSARISKTSGQQIFSATRILGMFG